MTQRKASLLSSWLIAECKIDSSRIKVIGESLPLFEEHKIKIITNEDIRDLLYGINRRIEILVL